LGSREGILILFGVAMAETKTKWVKVRIDEDERTYWHEKAQASGRTLSDLIRESLDRVRRWTPENKEAERERLRQFARIGANLNQIAKWANTHKSAADAAEVIAHLCAIESSIAALSAKKHPDSFPTAPLSKESNDANAGI
jgi:hypothetical protein